MAHGQLFVLSAPSGTGKTTLIGRLLDELGGLNYSISYTTRAPRPREKDAVDYHFLTRDQFVQLQKQDAFLECAEIFGELYGTPRDPVIRALEQGEDVILDLDEQGAESVKRELPGTVLVLLLPPSWEALEARLRARGETEAAIARRLQEAQATLSHYEMYHYLVMNNDIEDCVSTLTSIITAERCRRERHEWLVEELSHSLPQPGEV